MGTILVKSSVGKLERRQLPESASVLLDVIRFAAALLVVVAHATHVEFHGGVKDREILGDIAVPVFFVLSGFVIRFVTRTRETTAKEYFIDRASRIYSVVLPALAFTLLVSAICYFRDPGRFVREGWTVSFGHPVLRILFNLIFVSQAWGLNSVPFINSPFWSLGYECVYYVLFGIALFASGWRRVAGLALIAVAIGPPVMFLLPVWWVGCWIYDLYEIVRRSVLRKVLLGLFGVYAAIAGGLALVGNAPLLFAPLRLFWRIVKVPNPLRLLHVPEGRASMFAVAVGIYCAVLLFFLLLAVDGVTIARGSWWTRQVRRVADGTFAIYLMHYPFLVLVYFLGWFRFGHMVANSLVVAGIVVVLIAAAVPIDGLKRWMRRRLRQGIVGRLNTDVH